jgi:hypothetical protein
MKTPLFAYAGLCLVIGAAAFTAGYLLGGERTPPALPQHTELAHDPAPAQTRGDRGHATDGQDFGARPDSRQAEGGRDGTGEANPASSHATAAAAPQRPDGDDPRTWQELKRENDDLRRRLEERESGAATAEQPVILPPAGGEQNVPFEAILAGVVVTSQGLPVAGAEIHAGIAEQTTIAATGGRVQFAMESSGGGRAEVIAITDGAGEFHAVIRRDTREGAMLRVTLRARAGGYADSVSTTTTLRNGGRRDGLKLELRGAGSVSGRVVDGHGLGVGGVEVAVGGRTMDLGSFVYTSGGEDRKSAITGPGGDFVIENVPEGRHQLTTTGAGVRLVSGPREIEVRAGMDTRAPADYVVECVAGLRLRLLNPDGNPAVSNFFALLRSLDDGQRHSRMIATDAAGRGFWNEIPPGRYELTLRAGGHDAPARTVEIREGEVTDAGDIHLTSAASGSSGGITIPGIVIE